ncbi:MAG: LPS export ABC transporter periplasmic protein LptC [Burkholderiaceae bacterium]|nr:LPS export ABC transporter periplasmic protein LptC [Burkholderiaceae bacterium]
MNTAWQLIRRTADQLVVYLPVLLMGALALGSYWLVRNAPVTNTAAADRPLNHEADYFLRKFSIKTFTPEGKLKNELFGGLARHFPDTDTIEIDNVRIHNFNEQGRLTTITSANRAVSNGDNSEVQLYGNAQSVRESSKDENGVLQPRLEFKGEFLHSFVNEERLKSHLPVLIRRGNSEISADSLDYDNVSRVANLQGRVKAVLPAVAK